MKMVKGMSFRSQRGVALLVTLIILVVITTLGLAAMRSGLLHLAIGNNAQASMINTQAANAGLGAVEKEVTAEVAANPSMGAMVPGSGIFGMPPGTERIGCLKNGVLTLPTTANGVNRCASGDYDSGRQAVKVQVSIINPTNAAGDGQAVLVYGTDTDTALSAALFRTYSTSVIPNFGSSPTAVQDCLDTKNQDPATDNLAQCLSSAGASYTTVVQEYAYGNGGYVN